LSYPFSSVHEVRVAQPRGPLPLSLDDADGAHAGDLARQAGPVDHVHDVINVLVRLGLLLREALAALGAGDDAAGLQFLVDAAAAGVLDRRRPAHGPARAVAGRAEGALHAARLADQHPPRPPHVAGDYDRLADLAVRRGALRVARREGPRRPLAVDPEALLLAANLVLLELGDVVADVVDQVHLQLLPRAAEDVGEDLAGLLHEQLAVAPGE